MVGRPQAPQPGDTRRPLPLGLFDDEQARRLAWLRLEVELGRLKYEALTDLEVKRLYFARWLRWERGIYDEHAA